MPRVKGVKPNTILRHLIISWGWPPEFVERDDTWSPSPGDHNVVVHIKCHDNRNNIGYLLRRVRVANKKVLRRSGPFSKTGSCFRNYNRCARECSECVVQSTCKKRSRKATAKKRGVKA